MFTYWHQQLVNPSLGSIIGLIVSFATGLLIVSKKKSQNSKSSEMHKKKSIKREEMVRKSHQ